MTGFSHRDDNPPSASANLEARRGVGLGIAAYAVWGCFPLFFALFQGVPAWEILVHRILWSCLLLLTILSVLRRWGQVREAFHHPATMVWILGCAVLIAINWGVYIYAVERQQVLEASLGYFMTPLVNVALGLMVLRERLSRWQIVAIGLAAAGILIQLWQLGELPWISLVLALSFGCYGLLRKRVPLDGLSGLFVETCLLLPLALIVLGWLISQGSSHFGEAPRVTLLLLASGVLTTLPLLAFAGAAHRLRLATLGFLMYLNPTLQFVLALWVFGEPLNSAQLTTFVLIWIGLLLYSVDTFRRHYRHHSSH